MGTSIEHGTDPGGADSSPCPTCEDELISPGGTGQKQGAGEVKTIEGENDLVGELKFLNLFWKQIPCNFVERLHL